MRESNSSRATLHTEQHCFGSNTAVMSSTGKSSSFKAPIYPLYMHSWHAQFTCKHVFHSLLVMIAFDVITQPCQCMIWWLTTTKGILPPRFCPDLAIMEACLPFIHTATVQSMYPQNIAGSKTEVFCLWCMHNLEPLQACDLYDQATW